MQTSTSASTSDVDFSEWHRAMLRIRTTCVRSALTGLTLRGGLHVLSSMIFLLSKLRSSKKARKRALSWMDALIDTTRFTTLLGSMGGVYVLLDEGLSILLGKDRTSKWRSLIAGAAAGQLLRLTGSETKHYSLATYVLLRGLTLLVRSANREEKSSSLVHKLLALTRLEHGDTVLMCLSTSQIIYSFVMMPSTLPRSYIRFLTKQAAADSWVIKAMQELAVRNWSGIQPGHLQLLQGTPYAKLKPRTPCAYWHPGQSCPAHTVSVIPSSYLRALGVYVPMYLLPALLVHRQLLITKPYQIWPKIAVGIARSSLFLTVFVTLGFGALCAASNLAGTFTGPLIAGSVWLGGLATLSEKKSRRMELAMYCLSRALEAFGRCLLEWGVVDAALLPARLDVLLFSLGTAAIMHSYSGDHGKHRDVFRSKYLNVLDFLFGSTGMESGSITHLPSNRELMTTAARVIRTLSRGSLADMEAAAAALRGTSSAPIKISSTSASIANMKLGKSHKERREHGSHNALQDLAACAVPSSHSDTCFTAKEVQKQKTFDQTATAHVAERVHTSTTPSSYCNAASQCVWNSVEVCSGTDERKASDVLIQPARQKQSLLLSRIRRSATEPIFDTTLASYGEERVHGLDRGIRGVDARAPTREPSFSTASPESNSI